MNLRAISDQSFADVWPLVSESIDAMQAGVPPATVLWTRPSPPPPPVKGPKATPSPTRKPSIGDRLAELAVGETKIVYSGREPVGFMRKAAEIASGEWRTKKTAPNTWRVERLR